MKVVHFGSTERAEVVGGADGVDCHERHLGNPGGSLNHFLSIMFNSYQSGLLGTAMERHKKYLINEYSS